MGTREVPPSPVYSWGRSTPTRSRLEPFPDRLAPLPANGWPLLPFGNGRSYGDVCLNDGGTLLHTRHLDRLIAFDERSGILRCEAGALLSSLMEWAEPRGWGLPVVPGTKFVSVGGAIANDVHGKNHHRAGSFGNHVRALELLRSNGERLLCTPGENREWFEATIAGLGLTGLVTWAEIQLAPLSGPWFDVETVRFGSVTEFAELSVESDRMFEHTAAWFDCTRLGGGRLPGLFFRANAHAGPPPGSASKRRASMPLTPPFSLIGGWSMRAFNSGYARPWRGDRWRGVEHADAVLFPLDGIEDWNRVYGPRGFFQFQCVVPKDPGALAALLERVAASGEGSSLAVLKAFGDSAARGLLSFPRPGYTLALDFPNRGAGTLALLDDLGAIVAAHNGAIYPAKDSRMTPAQFRQFFPRSGEFRRFVDAAFSSDFWKRVTRP